MILPLVLLATLIAGYITYYFTRRKNLLDQVAALTISLCAFMLYKQESMHPKAYEEEFKEYSLNELILPLKYILGNNLLSWNLYHFTKDKVLYNQIKHAYKMGWLKKHIQFIGKISEIMVKKRKGK